MNKKQIPSFKGEYLCIIYTYICVYIYIYAYINIYTYDVVVYVKRCHTQMKYMNIPCWQRHLNYYRYFFIVFMFARVQHAFMHAWLQKNCRISLKILEKCKDLASIHAAGSVFRKRLRHFLILFIIWLDVNLERFRLQQTWSCSSQRKHIYLYK